MPNECLDSYSQSLVKPSCTKLDEFSEILRMAFNIWALQHSFYRKWAPPLSPIPLSFGESPKNPLSLLHKSSKQTVYLVQKEQVSHFLWKVLWWLFVALSNGNLHNLAVLQRVTRVMSSFWWQTIYKSEDKVNFGFISIFVNEKGLVILKESWKYSSALYVVKNFE